MFVWRKERTGSGSSSALPQLSFLTFYSWTDVSCGAGLDLCVGVRKDGRSSPPGTPQPLAGVSSFGLWAVLLTSLQPVLAVCSSEKTTFLCRVFTPTFAFLCTCGTPEFVSSSHCKKTKCGATACATPPEPLACMTGTLR